MDTTSLVPMLVMYIRIMRMTVRQRRMGVFVGMRFVAVPVEIVHVLMVFVMHVAVRVCDRLMGVQVCVPFGRARAPCGCGTCPSAGCWTLRPSNPAVSLPLYASDLKLA